MKLHQFTLICGAVIGFIVGLIVGVAIMLPYETTIEAIFSR